MLRELIKTKARLLYLEGGDRVSHHMLRSIFSVITFSIFAYCTYAVVKFATGYIIKDARLGLFLYHRLLALGLFVFFAIISVANILVAFATVFRNKETEFLHTLPIKPVQIFMSKFLDSFLYSSALMLILVLAAVTGYAGYFHNWSVAVFGLVFAVFPMILSAACIGSIILLLVLKFSNRISIKTAVLIVTALYAGGTYFYILLNNPFRLFTDVMKYYPHIDRYLGALDPKPDYFAPSFWAANFFYFATTRNFVGAAASALIVCGTAVGLFVLMIRLADKYYQDAFWIARHKLFERKMGKSVSSSEARGDSIHQIDSHQSSWTQPEFVTFGRNSISLLRRDLLLFLREPSQTFHFAVLLILIGIFLFNLFAMKIYLPDPFIVTSAFTLIFAFNSFLIVSLAVRFVYPMLSLEGESIWLLRSSPVDLKRVFYSKLLPSIIFLSFIGTTLGYAAPAPLRNFRGLIPVSIVYGLAGGITFPSVVMIFGGVFVDYKERNPVRISSSHGATVSLLVSVGIMIVLSSIAFNQTFSYFSSRGNLPLDLSGIWMLGSVLLVCVMLARVFGLRALQTDL
jgi:hypothetical protein